jgi:hypothetical protein
VQFNDERLEPLASIIVNELNGAGLAAGPPRLNSDSEPTLGMAQIVITLVATAATKAIVVASLRSIQRALESHLSDSPSRAQVVLIDDSDTEKNTRRFPINLRGLAKETLGAFVDNIVKVVNAL